jgi:hypothetical protein
MRFEFENGEYLGTAEWGGPGQVTVQMEDEKHQRWFENYFSTEDSFMTGPVDCAEMAMERRDESEQAFSRAAYALAAYSYQVRQQGDARRHKAHRQKGADA